MTKEYFRHRSGVAKLTKLMVLRKNPKMSENEILRWFLAGFLHDIGKEVIDKRYPSLFGKAGSLSEEEWAIVRTHTQIGYERLKESSIKEIENAALAALEHHERWNGSGYIGKKGLGISLQGRVVAIADVYDALCHDRPYRQAWDKETALEYIQQHSGVLFDPEWAEVLMSIETNGGK